MTLRMRTVRSRGRLDPSTVEEITDLTHYDWSQESSTHPNPSRAASPAMFDSSAKSDGKGDGDAKGEGSSGEGRVGGLLAHNHRRHTRSRSADSATLERIGGNMRRATSIGDEDPSGSSPSLPVRAIHALTSNISSLTANLSTMTSLAGQYAGGLVSGARSSIASASASAGRHYHPVATNSRNDLHTAEGSSCSLAEDHASEEEDVPCAPMGRGFRIGAGGVHNGHGGHSATVVESVDLLADEEEAEGDEHVHLCGHDDKFEPVTQLPGHRFRIRLIDFAALPDWLKDNDFIHTGYRPELRSLKQCFISMLYVHNETANVYTHLLGFTTFLCLALYTCIHILRQSNWEDHIVFWIFFLGAMICLLLSSLFHLIFCHSPRYLRIFSRLDYTGIAFLIAGSYFPCIYYAFYCERKWKIVYLSAISIIGSICIVVACVPGFDKPKFRVHRLLLFVAMGFSGLVPLSHFLAVYGYDLAREAVAFNWLMVMASCYLGGGIMYAARVPERYAPGKFDILFHSHMLFHLLVVCGGLLHYYAMMRAFNFRDEFGCTREEAMYP